MNSKRLKVSPKNAQRIIDTVLSDDKLVQYVISLVSRRLTAEMQSDAEWCNTVIDLSIDQVLNQVDVFEILKQLNETPQIKKSSHKNRENNNTDNNESFRPTFSSTEPKSVVSSSPRRVVKQLNKKKPIDLGDDNERSPPRGRIPAPVNYSRSMSVESDASTIPVVTQANSDGAVISKHLRSEQRDDWLAGVTAETRSESSISSAYEEEDMFAPSAAPSEANTSALQEDTDDKDNASEDSPVPRDPRSMRTAAAASDALHVTLVKSGAHQRADLSADNGRSLFNSTVILNSTKPESPGESAVLENDDFLSSWERKVLQGMRSGEESSDEGGDRAGDDRDGGGRDGDDREDDRGDSGSDEIHLAPNKVSISKSSDRVELNDDGAAQEVEEEEYSSDSSVSDDAPDYLSAPQLQSAGSAGGEKVLFFDQSRFDADADFFGSGESEGSPSRGKGKRRQSRPAEASPRRVRFAPQLISEVRFRDRVGYAEKDELFFTHNEEYQFMLDQTKETERAEALGKLAERRPHSVGCSFLTWTLCYQPAQA